MNLFDDSLYLFIWVLRLRSTLYMLYHDWQFYGQRKPVHTVCKGFVLLNADHW